MNFDELEDDSADVTGATPQGSVPQQAPAMSFDELPDESSQSQRPVASAQQPGALPSFDDLQDQSQSSGDQPSAVGAFTRAAVKAAPVGAGAGIGALQAGAVGAGLGTAAAPFLGPFAPAGPVVGGLLGGIAGAVGYGWVAQYAEDQILAALGWDKEGPLGSDQRAKDVAAHPYATFGGELAGNIGPAFSAKAAPIVARAIGAGAQGGLEAGMEKYRGEDLDPTKIGMATAAGAAFATPRPWAAKTANVLTPKSYRAGNTTPVDEQPPPGQEPQNVGGRNPNPDLKEIPLEPGQAPDITSNDVKPETATIPTAPQMETANPPANVARGTAEVKPPPPEIPGAGNPTGAPMEARIASAPHEPTRNYAKDTTAPGEQLPGVVETKSPVTPEIAAAITEKPEQVQRPQASADVPAPGEAAPTTPPAAAARPAPPPPTPASKVNELPQSTKPHRTELPAPEPEPRPTGLTPAEIKAAHAARTALKEAGHERLLAEIDKRKLNPRETAEALTRAKGILESQTGEGRKVGGQQIVGRQGEVRTETAKPKVSTGVVAASKGDLARKEGAIKKYEQAFNEVGPSAEHWKGLDPLDPKNLPKTKAAAKQSWERAKEIMGGDPFVQGSGIYVPATRNEAANKHVQYLKALKGYATGKTGSKQFATLHTTPEIAPQDRAVGRGEADIRHRPQLPEVAEANETAVGERPIEHQMFEPVKLDPRPNADNSVPKAENELRSWINDLSNRDYETLGQHYDIRAELNEPGDPHALMTEMMKTLADAGRRNVRVTPENVGTKAKTFTDEVELPASKVDLPEVPTGRKIDLKSDEGAKLKAMYEAQANKAGPAKTKAEQLRASEERERSIKEAGERTEDRGVDSTNPESLWNAAARFVQDEGGAGHLHTAVQAAARSLWNRFQNPSNPTSPNRSPGAKAYADSLTHGELRNIINDAMHRKLDLQANIHAGIDAAEKLQINTPYWHRKISLAEQTNQIDSLPHDVQDWWHRHVEPVKDQAIKFIKEMRDLNDQHQLGWTLPNLDLNTLTLFQPRYRVGKQAFDFEKNFNDAFEPFSGRTLSGWAPNLEDRAFHALEDMAGHGRMVFEKIDDNTIRLWRPNQPTLKIKVPPSFEGKLGDTIELKVKGKTTKFQVDQATTNEIETGTGGQVKYHENALWAWSRMADDVGHAVDQVKTFQRIKNSQEFKDLVTTDPKVAKELGYSTVTTHMPDFATTGMTKQKVYMPDALRWAFDDFHQPGLGPGFEGLDKLRNFNTVMLKVFNTNAPLVHVLNEANLFTVGRGFKWLSPSSTFNLVKNIGTAVSDVNKQGPLQREMRNAGVNPMLASTKLHNMYKTAAEQMGLEVQRNWRMWDSVFKPWGITAKEAGDKLYQLSSDVTWRLSDYLTTLRYMEERAAGWSAPDAAKRVNQYMSDYQLPQTLISEGKMGRALQQFVADQALTSFGRYKAGVWRALTSTTKNLVKGDPMLRQQARTAGFGDAMVELKARQEAAGQLIAAGLIATLVGPAMDHVLEKVTGVEGTKFRPRGVNAIVTPGLETLKGEKSVQALASRAWSPSPAFTIAKELSDNKTFSGKEIVPQGHWPGIIPEAVANVAEYAAQRAVPPYATVSKTYARPEGTPARAAGNFLLEQIGADIPSEAALKRENQIERVLNRGAKARVKRPSGIIPDLFNRVTE